MPSQSIVTIGDSAPARLKTLTADASATMDRTPAPGKSDKPSLSLLDKLHVSHDAGTPRERPVRRSYTPTANPATPVRTGQSSATTHNGTGQAPSVIPAIISVEAAGARSPSTVPALEPDRVITKEEMRTSGRIATLVPDVNNADFRQLDEDRILTVSGNSRPAQNEMANVHLVPIPFGKVQRDEYKNAFKYYRGEIQQFVDNDDSSSQQVPHEAEAALRHLRQVALHPDLVNDEVQSQLSAFSSTSSQVQWDADISCKFRFLREFLNQLRSQNMHVIVAATGCDVCDMLDRFLQGLGMSPTRLSGSGSGSGSALSEIQATGFRVSILDLGMHIAAMKQISPVNIMIAVNGTCDHQDPLVQAVRRPRAESGDWALLLILVVPCTVEHIERSLLASIANSTRVRTLLKTALKLQHQGAVGRLTPGQASLKEAAMEVSSFLASSTSTTDWPIEELGTLDNLDSQTETDVDTTLHGDSSLSHGDFHPASKRTLDIDIETSIGSAAKKPRASSVEADVDVDVDEVVERTTRMPATINLQDIELTHVSDSLGKATQSDHDFAAEVEQLRQVLSEKQDQLEEHVNAMSGLQYRHEAQRMELAKVKKERDEAIATAQAAEQRKTSAATQSGALRTERTSLKQQLEEVSSKLLDHSVPERREFENLRRAMEQGEEAKRKAEKQVEQAQKNNEWTREQYQTASSRARELMQQNAELEIRLGVAKERATGEQARARQASNDGRNNLLVKENRKLKAVLKDRESSMGSKDEEIARLKEAGRGRIGTRGSSVPRSPRMAGRNSRQGSPAIGELKGGKHLHPLRNG